MKGVGTEVDPIETGMRLRELRYESGETIAEVADEIGISYTQLGQYESGVRRPSVAGVKKLADFYNVDISYLIGQTKIKNIEDYEEFRQMDEEIESDVEKIYRKYLEADAKTKCIIDMIMDNN